MSRCRISVKLLLTLLLVFGIFTIITVTASAKDAVPYVVRSWDEQTNTVQEKTEHVQDYIELASTEISDNWYIVTGRVDLRKRLIVKGEVNLILCDYAYLNCIEGICVSEGNTLNIYCQEGESGKLHCEADISDNAAIGADDEKGDCGTINIYGGDITADTGAHGTDAAGIGGGDEGSGGNVTIYGGSVTAIGGDCGAGIGGGDKDNGSGNGGNTIIYGGTVDAKGGDCGAGIGGGEGGNGGTTSIYGGIVTATAGEDAVAIGRGEDGTTDGTVNFGYVKVTSGGSAGNATLQTTDKRTDGCHMAYAKVESCTEHSFSETAVSDNDSTHSYHCIYCDFTDEEHTKYHDIEVLKWKWAGNFSSATASVKCNTCGYAADITASGDNIKEEIIDPQTTERTLTATITINGVDYKDTLHKCRPEYMGRDGKMHQAGYCDKITKDTKDLENGWYAVVDNVKNNNRINCKGNVNLILCDGTTLDAPKGITVNEGNNLTIWGQENNAGKLTVNSPEKGAACIGGHYASSGQITINGGDINVRGNKQGASYEENFSAPAGIGGGRGGGYVTINGGIVNATGSVCEEGFYYVIATMLGGAGIGGSANSSNSKVTINGGVVTARGGARGAGIGCGGGIYEYNSPYAHERDSKGEVIINGGNIKAYGGEGAAGIGGGYGGRAQGVVTINGGIVTAEGNNNGVGIGGGQFGKGTVSINGGFITANAIGSGFGEGFKNSPLGSVTLGYGDNGVVLYSKRYVHANITLTKSFTDGKKTYEKKDYGENAGNTFKEKTLYPYGMSVVEWKNHDGKLLKKDAYKPGAMPVYHTGEDPTKEADEYYTYSHDGWAPQITEVTGNAVYTATFEKTPKIKTSEISHGKVTSDYVSTKQGNTVTLNTDPESGYLLKDIWANTIDRHSVHLTPLDWWGYDGSYYPSNLIDGNIKTKWIGLDPGRCCLIFKADDYVSMEAYALTTADNTAGNSEMNWKDWTIYGANFKSDSEAVSGSNAWKEIVSVKNDNKLPVKNYTQTDYVLNEPADPYKYYMIKIPKTQKSYEFQMAEFTMFDKYRGESVELSGSGDTRTFTMPEDPVVVSADFSPACIAAHSLSLEGDVGVVYFLDITDEQAKSSTVKFNWTVLDKGKEVAKSATGKIEKNEETGMYMTICPVSAAEMIYGIEASINIDGKTYKDMFAVAQYADIILSSKDFADEYVKAENAKGNDGEKRLKEVQMLMKTMLDYGSWAQVEFDRTPEILANRFFVTDDPSSPYYYVPEEVTAGMIKTGSSDMYAVPEEYGLEYEGSTIVYLSKTSMRHYYKVTDQAKFDAIKDSITFDGKKCGYTEKDDMIYFELQNISAPDLDKLFTLKIGNTEYKYSALDYVKECLSSENAAKSLKELSAATYRYNKAANVFFGEEQSVTRRSGKGKSKGLRKIGATAESNNESGDEYETSLIATDRKSIKSCTVNNIKAKTYTGKALTQNITVKDGSKTLKKGTDYTVSYRNNKNAGTATVSVTGTGAYRGMTSKPFKINKAKNPVKVKLAKASARTVKLSKVKKKAQRVKPIKVSKAQGVVRYKLKNVPSKIKKYIKISSKGVITIKKWSKARKGKYKFRIKVTAKGNKNYKSRTLTKKVKIIVK